MERNGIIKVHHNNMGIAKKIEDIRKLKDFSYLLNEKQDKKKIKEYYNKNKITYLFFHNKSGYLHMGISQNKRYKKSDLLRQVKIIKQEIENSSTSRVLELGYGRGANLYSIAKTYPQKKFIGIDLSTKPLKKYQRDNIKFIRGDYNNLDLVWNNFDLVFAIETLCHSCSITDSLKEVYSVMRPGAKLIIFDGYYLVNLDNQKKHIQEACRLAEKGMAVDHFHTLDELRLESKKIGFNIVEEQDFSNNILPSLYRFEKLAKLYFRYSFIFKLVNLFSFEMFTRNALSGYLMPELIKAKIVGYYMHILEKD